MKGRQQREWPNSRFNDDNYNYENTPLMGYSRIAKEVIFKDQIIYSLTYLDINF